VSESLRLLVFALAYLVLFVVLGSGPAAALGRRWPARVALAPLAGLALAMSTLASVAEYVSMRTAALGLLVPAVIVSSGWAVHACRQDPTGLEPREWLPPALVSVGALLLALLPGLLRRTVGPVSLSIADAWLYIQSDLWLQDHSLHDPVPAHAFRDDLSLAYGHAVAQPGLRIGASALNAAVSTLLRVSPDETHLALLGAIFALLPTVIWCLARAVGVARRPAALGAMLGLSPAALTLVGDSALANLCGLVLAPTSLVLVACCIRREDTRLALLSGLCCAGTSAAFPEFVPPTALAGLLMFVSAAGGRLWARRVSTTGVLRALVRLAVVLTVWLALAGLPTVRSWFYLTKQLARESPRFATLPQWEVGLGTGAAWAWGVLHLYEFVLPGQQPTAPPWLALLVAGGMSVFVTVGLGRSRPAGRDLVLSAVAATVALGLYAAHRYGNGACGYCLWKALTLLTPFVGTGLALSLDSLMSAQHARRWSALRRGLLLAVCGLEALALIRSHASLFGCFQRSEAVLPTNLRRVAAAARGLPRPATILIEGAAAAGAPWFMVPATYYLLRGPGVHVSFDARDWADYLGPTRPFEEYFGDYRYVLTAFPGVHSERRVVARDGPYALLERAAIDVAIGRTGPALEVPAGADPVPWLTRPFELWISSPEHREAALSIVSFVPAGRSITWSFRKGGSVVPAIGTGDGSQICVGLMLEPGTIVVDVVSTVTAAPKHPAVRVDTSLPPLDSVGLAAIRARFGSCAVPGPGDGLDIGNATSESAPHW
jgi:hypothetical protein